ncbi:hypothetical protein BH23ACT11_BH23ACT11_08640 [soil metagenome]
MVELLDRTADAAYKVSNLEDYERRLEKAARTVDEREQERSEAALVIYESVLAMSGRPLKEIRELVRKFQAEFEDGEEELTIPRVSGLMNVEGNEWFFGDDDLRVMTGRLLGQFQHRVAQYNYVNEREVLRRWANSHDTRLFIRRRIYETEPIVGVVAGSDLPLVQYLRVAAGGNTLVPTAEVSRALTALGFDETADEYEVLAQAESLALHLDRPAPIVAQMLEDIVQEELTQFPEPPRELDQTTEESSTGTTGDGPGPSSGTEADRQVSKLDGEQKPPAYFPTEKDPTDVDDN